MMDLLNCRLLSFAVELDSLIVAHFQIIKSMLQSSKLDIAELHFSYTTSHEKYVSVLVTFLQYSNLNFCYILLLLFICQCLEKTEYA